MMPMHHYLKPVVRGMQRATCDQSRMFRSSASVVRRVERYDSRHTCVEGSFRSNIISHQSCFPKNYNEMSSASRKFSNIQSPSQETMQFLISLGYSEAISNGIMNALLQNGIPPSSLFSMVKGLAGRYEVGEDGGLEALAASVKMELQKKEGKSTVKIWCLPSTGWDSADENDADSLPVVHSMERAFAVEALEGVTLTDVVNHGAGDNCDVLGEYLECACSGIMACSTCHVVIHPDWYDATEYDDKEQATRNNNSTDPSKIGPPSEAELDMIDLAYEPQLTSRLGCQIKITKELNGLVVLLPAGSNNLMDFVPFE